MKNQLTVELVPLSRKKAELALRKKRVPDRALSHQDEGLVARILPHEFH